MAEAATSAATPLLHVLPDDIVIWEILVRLDPKTLLRCRLVCRTWRCATFTRGFLLVHHDRQPTLPLVCSYEWNNSLDIILFDHLVGPAAAAGQLPSVARLGHEFFRPKACCGGLLILRDPGRNFSICNPATHQYAPLPFLRGFVLLGMYPLNPTSDYRLLLYWPQDWGYANWAPERQDGAYVFTIGSGQPPRHIGCPDANELIFIPSFLFRGSLHWHLEQCETASNIIMVYLTATESFRQMRAPVVPGDTGMFQMDGTLGMYSYHDADTIIDIWMLRDYESEVWAFKYRVELPVVDLTMQFGFVDSWDVKVGFVDGDLLMLIEFGEWLLQLDMDGKLVASFYHKGLNLTQNWLKQTLVPHTFFPILDGYDVNDWPFI